MYWKNTKDKKNKLKKISSTSKFLLLLIKCILLINIIGAIFLIGALISFHTSGATWYQITWNKSIKNLAGSTAIWLADIFLSIFGILGYIIPLIILLWCWNIFKNINRYSCLDFFILSLRLISGLVLIVTSCVIVTFNVNDLANFSSGGIIGSIFSNAILSCSWLSISEKILFLFCTWIISFTLFTGWSWLIIAEKIGSLILRITTFIVNSFRIINKYDNDKYQLIETYSSSYSFKLYNYIKTIINCINLFSSMPFLILSIKQLIKKKIIDNDDYKKEKFINKRNKKNINIINDKINNKNDQFYQGSSTTSTVHFLTSSTTSIEVKVIFNIQVNIIKGYNYDKDVFNKLSNIFITIDGKVDFNRPIKHKYVINKINNLKEVINLAKLLIYLAVKINSGNNYINITYTYRPVKYTPIKSQIKRGIRVQFSFINPMCLLADYNFYSDYTMTQQKQQKLNIDQEANQNHIILLSNIKFSINKWNENMLRKQFLQQQLQQQSVYYIKSFNKLTDDVIIDESKSFILDKLKVNTLVGNQTNIDKQLIVKDKVIFHHKEELIKGDKEVSLFSKKNKKKIFTQISFNQESFLHSLLLCDDQILPTKISTIMPSLDLLAGPLNQDEPVDIIALQQMAQLIEASLSDYRVKAKVVNFLSGPVITRFELNLAPGVKVARISNLSRDLARSLSVTAVRIVEIIPGKPYVGLELPNKKRQMVYLREVVDSDKFRRNSSPLTIVLGKDIEGEPIIADLEKMPHLLVAGTTGSGKSVGINAMILSILYKSKPEDVRFIMIDPKILELSIYEGIPHLLMKVVTDMKDAANALRWCVDEMERRYKLMSTLKVRNLERYNNKINAAKNLGFSIPNPFYKLVDNINSMHSVLKKEPYIVIIVDEFADLMMTVGKKIEELIARLAQKSRAAGIHLILATQRPSVDVITGLIKANIPTRIAFTVSSKIDSRTILDQGGAESLLGMGDMLYLPSNSSIPIRVHGAFVCDQEVYNVTKYWQAKGKSKYIDNIINNSEESSNNNYSDDKS